ncbi:MAG: hypothetical protein PHI49_06675 [Halothiobacillaceae bacterium]|nr:hypothetical protein [Halothiobacillaceae bacterium]
MGNISDFLKCFGKQAWKTWQVAAFWIASAGGVISAIGAVSYLLSLFGVGPLSFDK